MTTRRTWATGPLTLLAGLALSLVLAGPSGASEPGPAYPPGAGADDVVTAGEGAGPGGPGGTAGGLADGDGDGGATASAGTTDDGGTDGQSPSAGSEGAGGAEVGEPATVEDDDEATDDDDETADGDDDESATGAEASDRAAPSDGGRGAGPILVVVGTAVLLGGAVVAIARRL